MESEIAGKQRRLTLEPVWLHQRCIEVLSSKPPASAFAGTEGGRRRGNRLMVGVVDLAHGRELAERPKLARNPASRSKQTNRRYGDIKFVCV